MQFPEHATSAFPAKENMLDQKINTNASFTSNRCFGQELQNFAPESPLQKSYQPENLPTTDSFESEEIEPDHPFNLRGYGEIILNNLIAKETQFGPLGDYMDIQEDINKRMRAILMDWLVDVSMKFKLKPTTLLSSANLIDRYLARRSIKRQNLQLLGIACLMIISKFEEIYPPLVEKYVTVCANAYTRQEILNMEAEILDTIGFGLTQTSSYTFFSLFNQKLLIEDKPFAFVHYILETSLLEYSMLKYSNLTLACGAIFLTNKIFKCGDWTQDLFDMSKLEEKDVKRCAKELYLVMLKADKCSLDAIKRKFSMEKYHEVSKYKIEKVSGKGNK